MIFIDSNVPMYLIGAEHPNKSAAQRLLEDLILLEERPSAGAVKVRWDAPDPKDRIEIARRIAELTMSDQSLAEKAHEYEKLVQKDPSNPLLLLRYGEVLLKMGHYQFAEIAFRRALETGYSSAAPFNGLAATLYYQERLPETEAVLRKSR